MTSLLLTGMILTHYVCGTSFPTLLWILAVLFATDPVAIVTRRKA